MYYFNITVTYDSNMFNRLVVDNSDEIGVLLKTFVLSIFLFATDKKIRILSSIVIILNVFGSIHYGPQFIGLGSLSIIFLTSVIILYIISKLLSFNYKIIFISLIFFIPPLFKSSDDSLNYKINNIFKLSTFLFTNYSIYDLPNSAQIRVIETLNIISEPSRLFFGSGLGGYFVDNKYPFPSWTNKFDFSEKEIISGKYFKPHNFNYNLLKFGFFYFLVIFFLFLYRNSFSKNSDKILYVNLLFFIAFNFGAGIKAALCLGILLIVLSNRFMQKNYFIKSYC